MTPLAFDRSVCTDLTTAQRREWLVTNGLGGYASSTVGGLHTRRYHGLLVAALDPPLGRTVTLSKLEEVVSYAGRRFALSANRWADGTIAPTGFELLQSFALEGSIPRWRFAVADTLVDKRVWMEHGANTTYVQYTMVQGNGPLQLDIVALMTYRGHHATTRSDGWSMEVEAGADDLSVAAFEGATKLRLRATQGQWQAQHDWYLGLHLAAEAHRGLEHSEDVLAVGRLRAALEPGSSLTVWGVDRASAPIWGGVGAGGAAPSPHSRPQPGRASGRPCRRSGASPVPGRGSVHRLAADRDGPRGRVGDRRLPVVCGLGAATR